MSGTNDLVFKRKKPVQCPPSFSTWGGTKKLWDGIQGDGASCDVTVHATINFGIDVWIARYDDFIVRE